MSTKERIVHAILFEIFALVLVVPIAMLLTEKDASALAAVGVGLSLYTVVWNYFYNIWFDGQFGTDRAERNIWLRIGHSIGFEAGLIFVTVPVIAWFLGLSLWGALMLEAVFLVIFFFYAILFNWCFDSIRTYMVQKAKCY
ncbi:PACE efflux transporter [Shewanella colwelliana]|uniref:PACE efflux transporter n=1 Tax=Shewanella colwelliana TaxID=23 RepID=UPI0022B05663|nr:PACE efflux transporter [Shewanella colwelliana]MCZ4336312.1 PACE efflux transporter [Shewanella colwelliana]